MGEDKRARIRGKVPREVDRERRMGRRRGEKKRSRKKREECPSHGSIVVKRHHDLGHSYERKHLTGGSLTVLAVYSIVTMVGSLEADSAGAVAECLIHRQRERLGMGFETSET